MITNNLVGRYVELRSAKVEDAEFALNIRHTPKAMKFMPPLDITLEQQKSWIEKQRITEGDYFFIVFNKNNERVGVLSVYDIQLNGNGGTISGVPFIINKACKSLTAANTAAGDYCMAYGNLSNYQLVEFSPMEVKSSGDYKFREGMTAYRGVCFFGGNVVKHNGFLRVKKASS